MSYQIELIKITKQLEAVLSDTTDERWTSDDVHYLRECLEGLLNHAIKIETNNL